MLLQTNSYIVPRDKRVEHARLLRRFRQTLLRLGCDHFEVYEQTGANWSSGDNSGRFVQIMRFRDRKQQLAVQNAERADPAAQALLKEFCELINLPYQQQQGLFAAGFYTSFMRMPEFRPHVPGVPVRQRRSRLHTLMPQRMEKTPCRSRRLQRPTRAIRTPTRWMMPAPRRAASILNPRSHQMTMAIMPNQAEFRSRLASGMNRRRIPPFLPVREDGINGIIQGCLQA